jgi:hypothetical protein
VIAALASGPRLSRISSTSTSVAVWFSAAAGAPEAFAFSYFCEISASVPSARSSSRALFRSGSSPLFLRRRSPARSSPDVAAILTVLSPVSAR